MISCSLMQVSNQPIMWQEHGHVQDEQLFQIDVILVTLIVGDRQDGLNNLKMSLSPGLINLIFCCHFKA